MLKICLVFSESEPKYAYKLYAYKKKTCNTKQNLVTLHLCEIYGKLYYILI